MFVYLFGIFLFVRQSEVTSEHYSLCGTSIRIYSRIRVCVCLYYMKLCNFPEVNSIEFFHVAFPNITVHYL